ncbi:hypothetical protein FACS1894158_05980 [Betaproteobacteria bacterium]|nr:hypothetical protein FACS1894158_05980 [Betaproteobacteria bacterium]
MNLKPALQYGRSPLKAGFAVNRESSEFPFLPDKTLRCDHADAHVLLMFQRHASRFGASGGRGNFPMRPNPSASRVDAF